MMGRSHFEQKYVKEVVDMKRNVCGDEEIIRAVLGIVIMLAGISYGSWWGAIGLIPFITAVIEFCPINQAIHHSSCSIHTSTR